MIEDIATDVSNKLNNSTSSSDFNSLVGMESQMTKMRRLLQLDSDEVRIIGILGASGIGKTAIARYLFNQHSRYFQLSVFMESIKTIPACSDDYNVKLDLQKQFMSQLTNDVGIKIPHLGVAKDRLKDKKVLVVLDDVNRLVQLEAMAKETCWFGHGSRIIITTQDQNILKTGGIEHIYRVDLPSADESLQMLCMYAFGQKSPKDGFTELASEVTRLVGRLPLGLRVMGTSFQGMRKEDWRKALLSLETRLDPDWEIESILKLGYDAFCDEEKRLFLHIACFFNRKLVDIVEGCLASCFSNIRQVLLILAEKSLIDVDGGIIKMQELLVQLGRKIVRGQSEPGKRQFLNDAIDIRDVLNDDKPGSSSVLGICCLDDAITFATFTGERFFDIDEAITCTSERAFEKLSNLQFLSIRSRGINPRSLNSVSGKLRFLYWSHFRMTCFPSKFNLELLVSLDMPCSKLKKLWKQTQPLNNLKRMNLTFSNSLEELPDLSSAISLICLDLSGCSSLVKLPYSIGNAINLQKLHLADCIKLVELPSTIGNAVELQELELEGCSSLVKLPSSIGNAINLWKLNLGYCTSLVELPSTIGNAINLQQLNLTGCSSLMELPSSMRNLPRLSEFEFQKCSKLEVFLANINLESLEILNIPDCTNIQDGKPSGTTGKEVPSWMRSWTVLPKSEMCEIQELGPWIGRINCVRRLVLSGINLVSLPQLPYSVVELYADDCESLERLDCSFRNPDMCVLSFGNCFKLNQEGRDLIIRTPTNQYAVLPGGEVPQCFTNQSSGGSLTVQLNQNPLGTSTKFKACIVCVGDVENNWQLEEPYVSCSIMSIENALTCYKEIGRGLRGNLFTFEVEAEEVTSTDLVFKFEIHSRTRSWKTWEIKQCGILQILEVPLC